MTDHFPTIVRNELSSRETNMLCGAKLMDCTRKQIRLQSLQHKCGNGSRRSHIYTCMQWRVFQAVIIHKDSLCLLQKDSGMARPTGMLPRTVFDCMYRLWRIYCLGLAGVRWNEQTDRQGAGDDFTTDPTEQRCWEVPETEPGQSTASQR